MARRSKNKEQHETLIPNLPPNTRTVQVLTELGELKYKDPNTLAKTDEIQFTKDGVPIVMAGRPGRPKKVVLLPANAVVAEVVKRKQDSISRDQVLNAVKANPEDPDVLHQVVLALGEEAASLGFEREEAERGGRETSNISVRRVNTLKALADTWLKRKDQVVTRGVDLRTPSFKVLLQYILETFRETLELTGVRQEMIETILVRLSKEMGDEWENEAKKRMKEHV